MKSTVLAALCLFIVADVVAAFFMPNFDFNTLKRKAFPDLVVGEHPVPSDVKGSTKRVQHHSLLPPMLQNFDTNGFNMWDIDGSAVVTDNYVRLTPAAQSKHGCLWNTVPNELEEWSFRVGIRASGPTKYGADGLALWYTKRAHCTGTDSIFGAVKNFEGIGILLDTYDNDHRKDNPQIHILGSGDNHDPNADFMTTRLGGCQFDYRTVSPTTVVHVTARYTRGTLSVTLGTFDSGQVECASLSVTLSPGFYFGLSAQTGGLADEHDVYYAAAVSLGEELTVSNFQDRMAEERAKVQHGQFRAFGRGGVE